MKKISYKISYGIIISSLLVSLLVGFLMFLKSGQAIEREYREKLFSMVSSEGESLEESIKGVEEKLQFLEILIGEELELEDLKDKQGVDSYLEELSGIAIKLADVGDIFNIFVYLDTSDTDGFSYYYSKDKEEYLNIDLEEIKTQSWWDNAKDLGESWSEPVYSPNFGEKVITYTRKILDKKGRFIGVVGCDMEYNNIKDMLDRIDLGEDSYISLIDSKLFYLYHPDAFYVSENMEDIKDVDAEYFRNIVKSSVKNDVLKPGKKQNLVYYKLSNGWMLYGISTKWDIMTKVGSLQLDILLIILFMIVLTIFVSNIVAVSIAKPIKDFVGRLKQASEGDLRVRSDVKSKDEMMILGNSFNKFMVRLEELILEIGKGARNMEEAAQEINSSNQNLAIKSSFQATSLEKTSESMRSMNLAVNENAAKTEEAKEMVKATMRNANSIAKYSNELRLSIESIINDSNSIKNVIEVIDGIAFQTNLLAVNAAVEAARAGEKGKGFAVVASEIRKLSRISSRSSKEIKNLIKESVENIEDGGRIIEDTIKYLEIIFEDIERINGVVDDINASAESQKMMITQINKNVSDLEDVTQVNANIAEETSASMQMLYNKVKRFLKMVSYFKITEKESPEK